MTVEEVKDLLKAKGISQASLARKGKVSTAAMALFINRKMTSARLERLVAKELGVTTGELRQSPEQAA